MNSMQKHYKSCTAVLLLMLITACSPEVGSDRWCAAMSDKPKGEWTANEVADYAKHCLLK